MYLYMLTVCLFVCLFVVNDSLLCDVSSGVPRSFPRNCHEMALSLIKNRAKNRLERISFIGHHFFFFFSFLGLEEGVHFLFYFPWLGHGLRNPRDTHLSLIEAPAPVSRIKGSTQCLFLKHSLTFHKRLPV